MDRLILIVALAVPMAAAAAPQSDADNLLMTLRDARVNRGLIVHVHCGNGELTAALAAQQNVTAQGLDVSPSNVSATRENLRARGDYGRGSAISFDGSHLPYVDNLATCVVVGQWRELPRDEAMRVLQPGGALVVRTGNRWKIQRKPWPNELDQWTHYLHGSDNNAVSMDRRVGPPQHMQWLAAPLWTRDHHADKGGYPTIRAVVSARGRLFYLWDVTPTSNMNVPSQWYLMARDGFNGLQLWQRRIKSQIFQRRLEDVWRTLIADGEYVYVALGTNLPLAALDAATGKVVRRYQDTAGLREVVKCGARLLAITQDEHLVALAADTGVKLWTYAPPAPDRIVPLTLAAIEDRVYVKTDRAAVCLDVADGTLRWQTPLPGAQQPIRLKFPREKLIATERVVLCSFGGRDPRSLNRDKYEYLGSHPRVHEYEGKLAALAADDGHMLWQTDYYPGLESTPGEIYIIGNRVWLGPDFSQPRDLVTGKVVQTRPVIERLWTDGHHYRCYPGKATVNYILTAKRGIEFIDTAGDDHVRNNWVRGTCRVGVTPSNGLIYAPPHSCGCYIEAKLNGFWALAARQPGRLSLPDTAPRLQRGPAYDAAQESTTAADSGDWPTYRGNATRSGVAHTDLRLPLHLAWQYNVGSAPSAPTIADGKVYVAAVDQHTLHALDAATGTAQWQFTADGRIDSPPTLVDARALFGAHDGHVYCLRAADGQLAWKFRAADSGRLAVAMEQVESLWPVTGPILVKDNTAYLAAGRSSYLDGGIHLFGIDLQSGKVRHDRHLSDRSPRASTPPPRADRARMLKTIRQNETDYKTFTAPDLSDAFAMHGAKTGVLSASGGSIFMRQLRFDLKLASLPSNQPHLFSTSTLLDGWEHNRSYWMLGTGDFRRTPVAFPWIVAKSLAVPYGLMMAFDKASVWGVHRVAARGRVKQVRYNLYTMARPDVGAPNSKLPDFAERTDAPTARPKPRWQVPIPGRPRALLKSGGYVLIACDVRPDATVAAQSTSGGETSASLPPGAIHIFTVADGKLVDTMPLPASPTWDGMAAANGRLFVTLTDGTVTAWETGEPK